MHSIRSRVSDRVEVGVGSGSESGRSIKFFMRFNYDPSLNQIRAIVGLRVGYYFPRTRIKLSSSDRNEFRLNYHPYVVSCFKTYILSMVFSINTNHFV